MNDSISPEELVELAIGVRSLLQEADRLELIQVGIHLDAALNSIADIAQEGTVAMEPYALPVETKSEV